MREGVTLNLVERADRFDIIARYRIPFPQKRAQDSSLLGWPLMAWSDPELSPLKGIQRIYQPKA